MANLSSLLGVTTAILSIALLIFVHEAGHFLVARMFKMRVKRFSLGFFKPLIEWKPKGSETTYAIGAVPLGGFVQVDGLSPADEVDPEDKRSYANQPIYARVAMVVGGPLANFLFAVVVFVFLFAVHGYPVEVNEAVVGDVSPSRPAGLAGLQGGDRIVSIGGQPVSTWDEMAAVIHASPGKALDFVYRRQSEDHQVSITPELYGDQGIIGISPTYEMTPLSFGSAVGEAFHYTAVGVVGITFAFVRIVSCQQSSADVSGPVGITTIIAERIEVGWADYVRTLAMLSISLCVLNFLPFPALDGGRVIFLVVELVARRRVNRTIEGYVHAVGFLIVIGLVLLVTVLDVQRCMS